VLLVLVLVLVLLVLVDVELVEVEVLDVEVEELVDVELVLVEVVASEPLWVYPFLFLIAPMLVSSTFWASSNSFNFLFIREVWTLRPPLKSTIRMPSHPSVLDITSASLGHRRYVPESLHKKFYNPSVLDTQENLVVPS